MAIMATLETWVPGAVAPATKSQALIRYANRDGERAQGIDPHREPKVSMLATQMRLGTLASLYRASNAIILGNRLAEGSGTARLQHHRADDRWRTHHCTSGRVVPLRHPFHRREHSLCAGQDGTDSARRPAS